MNPGFQFKQFFVRHDRCAMKVGTDGVLLGAWAPFTIHHSPFTILDVGTGSGLIALMLAQRCPDARIDAIDIDPDAVAQARDNFAASPWADRLHAAHCSLQELSDQSFDYRLSTIDYDLIVSNPPYFTDSLKNPDAARRTARHNDTLPFSELIAESARRLTPDGILALIVPAEAEQELQTLALQHGLQCTRRCYVHPKPERPAKRVMIAWQRTTASAIIGGSITHLTLEDAHAHRSPAYRQLTRDFYL